MTPDTTSGRSVAAPNDEQVGANCFNCRADRSRKLSGHDFDILPNLAVTSGIRSQVFASDSSDSFSPRIIGNARNRMQQMQLCPAGTREAVSPSDDSPSLRAEVDGGGHRPKDDLVWRSDVVEVHTGEHRTSQLVQRFGCGRSEQETPEQTSSMCRHHDEVDLMIVCVVHDCARGVALNHDWCAPEMAKLASTQVLHL